MSHTIVLTSPPLHRNHRPADLTGVCVSALQGPSHLGLLCLPAGADEDSSHPSEPSGP